MSGHPMHGTKPLERSSSVAAVFCGSPGRAYQWKTIPPREGWGQDGRRIFVGSEAEARTRADALGIPQSEVRRA